MSRATHQMCRGVLLLTKQCLGLVKKSAPTAFYFFSSISLISGFHCSNSCRIYA